MSIPTVPVRGPSGDPAPGPPFVTLPMYDFPEVADATAALGSALVQALSNQGQPARWRPTDFADHQALVDHWTDPRLILSQTCGLPLVEALAGQVFPLGTWSWSGVTDQRGRYRSVIVAHGRTLPEKARVRVAINSYHSLSGWTSLGVFLAHAGLSALPPLVTGSHRASLAALTSGQADLASIDAVTWSLAGRFFPREREELAVVGEGPEVPALPLITSGSVPRGDLFAGVDEALWVLRGRWAAQRLGIEGFVKFTPEDFSLLPDLVQEAEITLPRNPGRRTA